MDEMEKMRQQEKVYYSDAITLLDGFTDSGACISFPREEKELRQLEETLADDEKIVYYAGRLADLMEEPNSDWLHEPVELTEMDMYNVNRLAMVAEALEESGMPLEYLIDISEEEIETMFGREFLKRVK